MPGDQLLVKVKRRRDCNEPPGVHHSRIECRRRGAVRWPCFTLERARRGTLSASAAAIPGRRAGTGISANTIGFHYGKHHRAYVDNLNKQVSEMPDLASLSLIPGEGKQFLKEEDEGRDQQTGNAPLARQPDHERDQRQPIAFAFGYEPAQHVGGVNDVGIGEPEPPGRRRVNFRVQGPLLQPKAFRSIPAAAAVHGSG